jgi:hypothetical protein
MTPNDPGMDFGAPRRRQGGGRPAAPFDDSQREQGIMNQYPRPQRPSNIGRDRMGGVMGLNGGQASDTYTALMGGMNRNRLSGQQMAYRPGTYGPDYGDDDYGPFIPESVLEMDEFGGQYDPDDDEAMFDLLRGNLQMTELTQDQKNKMRNQYNAPGLESAPTKQQLFDQIKDMEYKGTLGGYWPGWLGANPPQEDTTWGEFDKEYKHLQDTYWA